MSALSLLEELQLALIEWQPFPLFSIISWSAYKNKVALTNPGSAISCRSNLCRSPEQPLSVATWSVGRALTGKLSFRM